MKSKEESKIKKQDRMRYGHRWTQDEIITLMSMWDAGDHVDHIAKSLKSSTHSIMKMIVRLRQQGIPLKRRTRGRRLGPDNRRAQLWTQAEIEYLVTRRRDRATIEEIAAELGRSWSAINAMIYNLRKRNVDVPRFGIGIRRLYDVSGLRVIYGEPDSLTNYK